MIRSLTIGLPVGTRSVESLNADLGKLLPLAAQLLDAAGLDCRTTRITLPPCGSSFEMEGALESRVGAADSLASANGVRWYCVPLDFTTLDPVDKRSAAVASLVQRFPRAFINFQASQDWNSAGRHLGEIGHEVLRITRLSNNGFDNFRVGASFNCEANTPFFPFSYHRGDKVAFSFALETTSLALTATEEHAGDFKAIRESFRSSLTKLLTRVESIGRSIEAGCDVEYRGADASLAPLPDGRNSVANLVERIIGSPMGSHGTLAATAALTDDIRAAIAGAGTTSVGFNGVMYSVLEDQGLAAAVSNRLVGIPDLVSYAGVCGCGLDMVPIAGHAFKEEIASLMLDVGALSAAARKPLGVRVLPVPGKRANEYTSFNQDFLCDSRVMSLGPHVQAPLLMQEPPTIGSAATRPTM